METKHDDYIKGLERLADELRKRKELFRHMFCWDPELQARFDKLQHSVVIYGAVNAGPNISKRAEQVTQKLFNAIGFSFSKVTCVQPLNFRDNTGRLAVKVTLEDSEAKKQVLNLGKNLHERKVTEKWMKDFRIRPDETFFDRYTDKLLDHEKYLRNEISKRNGENIRWTIRSRRVVEHTAPDRNIDSGLEIESDPDSGRNLRILELAEERMVSTDYNLENYMYQPSKESDLNNNPEMEPSVTKADSYDIL